MTECEAEIIWTRGEQDFLDKRYSRLHVWRFDGGIEIAASSSPHVVPLPMSDATAVDLKKHLLRLYPVAICSRF